MLPTTISTLGSLGYHRELFELGLLKYADVFDLHPYVAYPPEQNGLLGADEIPQPADLPFDDILTLLQKVS